MYQPGVVINTGGEKPPIDKYGRPYACMQFAAGKHEWKPAPLRNDEFRQVGERETSLAIRQIMLIQAMAALGDGGRGQPLAGILLAWQRYLVNLSRVHVGNNTAVFPERPEVLF